jgi:glucans biosynthesis protein
MLSRHTLGVLLAVLAGTVNAAGKDFDFDSLQARARQLAAASYSPPPAADAALVQLDPARLRALSIRPRFAPWSMASRFVPLPQAPRADCAPTLFNSIQASGVIRFDYRPELFDWPAAGLPTPGPAAPGFCGFDVLYPTGASGARQDFARLGGDALQLVGTGQAFGAAALAVGVIDNDGRAQPVPFREFWLVRPAAGARQLRLYALAQSQALVGAFQIDLVPGPVSRARIRVALYPREGAGKLVLAPLAGNFVQGEHRSARALPLQAEVHSVDGLAINTATGGWIWRPLGNPPGNGSSSFLVNTPRGFGLLQRDRDGDHYDPDAPGPRQPDVWLVPGADWGSGQLRLFESAADSADVYNVLVGFVPDQQPAPGAGLLLDYAVQWSTDDSLPHAGGWVVATRSGAGDSDGSRRYAVDFVGPALQGLLPGEAPAAVIDIGRGGGLQRQRVVFNPHTGGWRLLFEFKRETDALLRLRTYLRRADQPLTETWDYVDPSR